MRRRDFLLGAAVLVGDGPAVAQKVIAHARIGWLAHGDTMPRHFFEESLARLGWVQGQNLTIERRFATSAGEHESSAASEIVGWRPDVIVALGGIDAKPIIALTRDIPVVVVWAADPVGQGLAASLAKPGGNVTGTAALTIDLLPKLLELVHELLPGAGRISLVGDPRSPGFTEPSPSVGKPLGLTIVSRRASRPEDLDTAFAAAAADRDHAAVIQFVALTFEERWRITALASRFRLPTIYPLREYVEAGGLISYGPAIRDNFERAAVLADKILRGASPSVLPFEQPTHFECIVNLKTAGALGLSVPPSVLARADEVIE